MLFRDIELIIQNKKEYNLNKFSFEYLKNFASKLQNEKCLFKFEDYNEEFKLIYHFVQKNTKIESKITKLIQKGIEKQSETLKKTVVPLQNEISVEIFQSLFKSDLKLSQVFEDLTNLPNFSLLHKKLCE